MEIKDYPLTQMIKHVDLYKDDAVNESEEQKYHKYDVVIRWHEKDGQLGIRDLHYNGNFTLKEDIKGKLYSALLTGSFLRKLRETPFSEIIDFMSYHYSQYLGDSEKWFIEIGTPLELFVERYERANGNIAGYSDKDVRKLKMALQWIADQRNEDKEENEGKNDPKEPFSAEEQVLLLHYLGFLDKGKIKELVSNSKKAVVISKLIRRSEQKTRTQYLPDIESLRTIDRLDKIEKLFEKVGLDTTQIIEDHSKTKN